MGRKRERRKRWERLRKQQVARDEAARIRLVAGETVILDAMRPWAKWVSQQQNVEFTIRSEWTVVPTHTPERGGGIDKTAPGK